MFHRYTECIGDYVLEGACHAKRVEALTHAEGTFYAHLGHSQAHNVTRRNWSAYSNALTEFSDTLRERGRDADATWRAATQVLVAGRMLGDWLDVSLHRK